MFLENSYVLIKRFRNLYITRNIVILQIFILRKFLYSVVSVVFKIIRNNCMKMISYLELNFKILDKIYLS